MIRGAVTKGEHMSVQSRIRAALVFGATATIAVVGAQLVWSSESNSTTASTLDMQRIAVTSTPRPGAAPAKDDSAPRGGASTSTPMRVSGKATPVPTTVATALRLTAAKNPVTAAQQYRAVLRAVLTASNKPLAAQQILLLLRVTGTKLWTPVAATDTTALNGSLSIAVSQTAKSLDFKAVYSGKGKYAGSVSATVTVLRK
jgi:hypothetical protein